MTTPKHKSDNFAKLLLLWFDAHGRKHLPWQQDISPYKVWLSEIMLQQTQVETVIPYFEAFLQRFPDIDELAKAPLDEVLHLWTGLGYYARGRNLHKCAQILVAEHSGQLPADLEQLCALPGIGRSTAGAILSIAFKQRAAILDGNVKRVLARYHAIEGWPGQTQVQKELWHWAEKHTPRERFHHYTQAIMDIGATVCTRSRPKCHACPLVENCEAYTQGITAQLPSKKPKKDKPVKTVQMLLIINPDNHIFLSQRAPQGLWGGLWSLPEISHEEDPRDYCRTHFGKPQSEQQLSPYRHTFSHFHMDITPVVLKLRSTPRKVGENSGQLWYNTARPAAVGLAAPVKNLLERWNSSLTSTLPLL